MSKELKEARVIPGTRDEFLEEWRSDPQGILDKANEANLTLEGYADVRAPATQESPGSAMEWLLYNEGIRMTDTHKVPSTPGADLPDIAPKDGNVTEPLARALIGYWDEVYTDALLSGKRATAAVSSLTKQGGWRPIYMDGPVRSPNIAAGFNFLDVVAYSRTIADDTYRVRQWNNDSGEQKFQKVAEGTEPKLFEITRSTEDTNLNNYRVGIEWTDSFINNSQTRASDITNAIEEVAIGHRIELLGDLGKLIVDSRPSANQYDLTGVTVGGVAHVGGTLQFPHWVAFLKRFGNAYTPNVSIGNINAITTLELMSMTGGDQNITYGSWSMVPNTNIRNLNGDLTEMNYGYISNTGTGLTNTEIFTFQRETTLVYVQQLGGDQDELERVPGPRKTRRWLGAKAAFAAADKEGIRSVEFS